MNDPLHDHLLALASTQRGLITRLQVTELGGSRSAWRHLATSGEWERLTLRVLRRRGSPEDAHQRALAAVLDMGLHAYLSHTSAAALWGLPGFRLEPLHLIVTRVHATPSTLATVHHPRHLPDPFAARLQGIPVVRPALMLLELAPTMHPEQLRRRFDWMWSRHLVSAPSVRAELGGVMQRGRPGTATLRHLLDSLPPDHVPTASGLESRFDQICRDHDLPRMRLQVDLGDGEQWCGRVDFLAVDVPLVVEVQSERFHGALSDREHDIARRRRLEQAGFIVAEVWDHQVWHRVGEVVAVVRAHALRAQALAARRAA